jgi:hypothetical protein
MLKKITGISKLRPRARLLRSFGDELISNETVAISELVKNSYDADSTRVRIKFKDPIIAGSGTIEVMDNGNGMSLETLQTTWVEPATLFKKKSPYSERKNRRVLGEKGIGRFASSRLARYLEVITRRLGDPNEIIVSLDWEEFDDENKYLDQIEIKWEERPPKVICPDGKIRYLWKNETRKPINDMTHGTLLRMKNLRSNWDEKQFEALRIALSKLINPFSDLSDFTVILDLPEQYNYLSGPIESVETSRNPHYRINGSVDVNGVYSFQIKNQSETDEINGKFSLENGRVPICGPIIVDFRIWDRDKQALHDIASQFGLSLTGMREKLNELAGISVYRDGFRVLPYGEPQNDWLRLDLRSRLNPTLRLANNQIIGYISITADDNPLKDQSNREGIMDGQAFDDLKEIVIKILNEMEVRRYKIRREFDKKPSKKSGVFVDFDLDSVRKIVEKKHPKDLELLKLIQSKEKDLDYRIKEVQSVISRYRRLATLGQLIDSVLHEGRAPVAKIINEVDLGLNDLKRKIYISLSARFETIKKQTDSLKLVFNRIEPFGGRKRGVLSKKKLGEIIKTGVDVLQSEIDIAGIKLSVTGIDTFVRVDDQEIQEVIVNLLMNSLYWLGQVPKKEREIVIDINRVSDNEVSIIFSDSGPGVDLEIRDQVFDPYFSTRPNGVGLGLSIAGEIVNDYYDGELELLEEGPLSGATFKINLRKRVKP